MKGLLAMQRVLNFLAGLLIGGLVGAVAALLFAPMSGDELRGEVQNRTDQVVTDIRTAMDEERKRLEAELEALKRGEIKIA
jgi:gas vesicle protein